jgi:hypothetical protein
MSRHIFVDNANIFSFLRSVKSRLEPDVPAVAVRLHLDHLFDLVENGEHVETRAFGGSENRTAEAVWDKARDRGYDTYILQRVTSEDGKTSEQAVDEVMHLLIANAVLDFDALQTLVIVSGDGKESNFGMSFVSQAGRALRHGWHVEIWSWSDGMTARYDHLIEQYPGRIKKRLLDHHYYSISFVEPYEGKLFHHDGAPASNRARNAGPVDLRAENMPEPFMRFVPDRTGSDSAAAEIRDEQPWI